MKHHGRPHARVAWIAMALASWCCGAKPEVEEKAEPTEVKAVAALTGTVTEWIELQGRVAPPYDRDALLAPLVAGRIVEVRARVGALVNSGDVLARVETGALDDELKSARAAVARSEADARFKRGVAKRSADLLTKGVASREESESAESEAVAAEAAFSQDQATLATAERRRGWSELKAPFAGVIVRLDRRVGDFVDGTSATPVVEVAAADGAEIVASASPSSLQRLRLGQTASIEGVGAGQAATDEDKSAFAKKAVVIGVARAIDVTTGAGEVRLKPATPFTGVALGTPVNVRISVASHKDVLVVPATAIRINADGASEVIVVDGGKARVVEVETGVTEMGRVEIRSGLKAGDRVVAENPIGLEDGAALSESTPEPEGEAKSDKTVERDKAPSSTSGTVK